MSEAAVNEVISLTETCQRLHARIAELESDRSRLDWLEKQMPLTLLRWDGVVLAGDETATGVDLRVAIDSGMKRGPK